MQEIKEVLEEFNRKEIKYCVLRNYEFLLDSAEEKGFDFDLVVAEEDYSQLEAVFKEKGFIKSPPQFSLKHQGFGKVSLGQHQKIGFDVQKGGIYWNDIPYLKVEQILPRRIKKGYFYVLSEEDAFLMYLCHSLLGKRHFKEKYKLILVKLSSQLLDFNYIENNLSRIFSHGLGKSILKQVQTGQFKQLGQKAYFYAVCFVLSRPKQIWPFFCLFFRWLREKRIGKSSPLISFIGPDGSGKSTNAFKLKKVLEFNQRKVGLVYTGRGKGNLIPIKAAGNLYKNLEAKKEDTDKKNSWKSFIYTLAAPVYTLDLLLRYWLVIWPKRKLGRIVITDRYCSDILLMKHVPLSFKKFLLWFFSRPNLTFYLYSNAEVLYQRRKQQPVEELNRQMNLFLYLVDKFEAISIRTSNSEKDFSKIEQKVFDYLIRNRR